MYSRAETGLVSIFSSLVVLCMLSFRPVIFDLCEVTAMRFYVIPWIQMSDNLKPNTSVY